MALMWRLFIYAPTDDGDLQHSCTEDKKLDIVPGGKYGFETGIFLLVDIVHSESDDRSQQPRPPGRTEEFRHKCIRVNTK